MSNMNKVFRDYFLDKFMSVLDVNVHIKGSSIEEIDKTLDNRKYQKFATNHVVHCGRICQNWRMFI